MKTKLQFQPRLSKSKNFLLLFFFLAFSSYLHAQCEWTVHVWDSNIGDEVEWELRTQDGNILLSGGPYFSSYNDQQSVTAEGPLTFWITNEGWFNDNTPNYEVSNGVDVLVSGQLPMFGDPQTFPNLICTIFDDCTDAVAGTVEGDALACSGEDFTITAEGASSQENGLQGQWQSSTDNNSWEDIEGATQKSLTTHITEDTYFRYFISCEYCGDDTSDSFLVSINTNVMDCYCEPTATNSTYDYVSSITTSGAETNLDYSVSSGPGIAYIDQTDSVLEAYPGQQITINTSYAGGRQTMGIWVDWDANGNFDDGDETLLLNNATSPQSVQFIVPEVDNGEYRMRIRGAYDFAGDIVTQGNDFACNHQDFGTAVDFTFLVIDTPDCVPPINLNANSITSNSADFSWESSADSFNIEWGEAGFEQGEGTLIQDVSSTYQLTDLNPNTTYEFYVQADCADNGLSTWAGPSTFTTACVAFTDLPHEENFDDFGTGPDAFPDCWERPVTYVNGTDIWPSIVSINAMSGNSLKFQSLTDDPVYAVSPAYEEDIQNLRVSFWLKREGTDSGTIDVGVMSDASDTSTFELIETINPPNNDYTEYIYDLFSVDLSGGNNYIAFRHNSNSSIWYYWLDDFKVELSPSCIEPTDLSVNNIHTDSATLNWSGNSDSYNIEWGEAGFTQGEGNLIENAENPYELVDLDENTAYEFYVQAKCGDNDASSWTGPFNFLTACGTIADLPYEEGFDDYGTGPDAFPNCWRRPVTYVNGSDVWPSIVSVNAMSGNSLRFQSAIDDPVYAVSPAFEEDIQNLKVSFWLKREGTSSGTIDVGVMSDASDTNTFELVATIDPENNDYTEYEYDLSSVNLSGGNNYIALRQNSNSAVWYYWLDDFKVDLAQICTEPTDISVNEVTDNSAEISWEGDADTYEIEYGEAGFTQGEGTVLTDMTSPYILTDLEANTSYDVYIRSVCDEDKFSSWAGPESFTTEADQHGDPYCQGDYFEEEGGIESFTTSGGIDNIDNQQINDPTGYHNFTDMVKIG